MKPSKQKRAPALLLSLAAALSLMALPAHASRFQDVADSQLSQAADALSALGVVSGTGEGEFSPDGHLTRAQLCKMAVEILGMGEQAQAQAYRTIFTDMGKGHWARGYVNLAAVTEVPAESGVRLMLGLGDGTFGPDREVTYQETATLALRILGYGAEANRAWPHSAIETASQLGLDQGLGVERPSDPITRGQTALLLYHLLSTPAKGGDKPYAEKLGTLVDQAILLTGDASINGQSGWVVVAEEGGTESYLAAGQVDQALLGKRGWALLDQEERFVTLLPDESSCVTAPVQRKQAYSLYLNNQRYTMSESTPVYVGSANDVRVTTYKDYMADLPTGTMVTLYLNEQGKVTGLYRAAAAVESRFLVVGNRGASSEVLKALAGDERNYTIRKNGKTIAISDIKQYDVVTYDPIAKVMDVCDVRLNCMYENAKPNATTPSQITAAGGNKFDVMADAVWDFAGRKLGDSITLLLTPSGKVAGLLPKDADVEKLVSASALGVLTQDGKFQMLHCDLTLDIPGELSENVGKGDLLNARSTERGTLKISLAGSHTNAAFNTKNMNLNGMPVSPSVQIYERTAAGLRSRSVSELPDSVDAAQYHRDSTGKVDLLVLRGYSGDGVDYGRIDLVTAYSLRNGGNGITLRWVLDVTQQIVFTGKDGTKSYSLGDDEYVARGYGAIEEGFNNSLSVTRLQAIADVPSSAFYTQGGVTYVRTSKGVYQVDEDVLCFNAAASYTDPRPEWVTWMIGHGGVWEGMLPEWIEGTESWSSGAPKVEKFSSLGECRSFSDTVTVYVDKVGQRVRIVESGA